jgi:hypothetical protein
MESPDPASFLAGWAGRRVIERREWDPNKRKLPLVLQEVPQEVPL